MRYILFLTIAMAAFTFACADPAANKPKATTTEAANKAAAPAEVAKTDSLEGFKAAGAEIAISPENSKVEFTGSKVTGKHDGGFKAFRGVIDLVGEKAEGSRVVVEIDMDSVFTDAEGLTKHLQTDDFFFIEKYPKSSFASTKIAADASKGADTYTVTGDLTMRGVKKSITFPATIKVSAGEVTVQAEFSINRKDFGIAYAGKADDLIRDDVVLRLDLKAPRKK